MKAYEKMMVDSIDWVGYKPEIIEEVVEESKSLVKENEKLKKANKKLIQQKRNNFRGMVVGVFLFTAIIMFIFFTPMFFSETEKAYKMGQIGALTGKYIEYEFQSETNKWVKIENKGSKEGWYFSKISGEWRKEWEEK